MDAGAVRAEIFIAGSHYDRRDHHLAQHVVELRAALSMSTLRAPAKLPDPDLSAGHSIKAVHLSELRLAYSGSKAGSKRRVLLGMLLKRAISSAPQGLHGFMCRRGMVAAAGNQTVSTTAAMPAPDRGSPGAPDGRAACSRARQARDRRKRPRSEPSVYSRSRSLTTSRSAPPAGRVTHEYVAGSSRPGPPVA